MLKDLRREDVPEQFLDILDLVGMDVFIELVKFSGGSNLYLPNENTLVRPVRNRLIRERFRGDFKVIAREFGISEMQARNIINKGKYVKE